MSKPRIADDFAAIAAAMRALGLEEWDSVWRKEDTWLALEGGRQERLRLEQEAAWQELVNQRPRDEDEQMCRQMAMQGALNQSSQLQQSALAPMSQQSQLQQSALAARVGESLASAKLWE